MINEKTVAAYLRRVGAKRPEVLDAAALRHLHRMHQLAVPFENLSIHLSEPISLDQDDLVAKIVTRRRGGFCYELNGAFALLLEALGAEVRLVSARVYGADGLGVPFDHLALLVQTADRSEPWLADVGFGGGASYPLQLDSRAEQEDPVGRFQLAGPAGELAGRAGGLAGAGHRDLDSAGHRDLDGAGYGDLDVLRDGQPQYRVERRPLALADFVPTCWYQQTSPRSHFTRSTVCSRLTEDGRISLSGRTLIVTSGGARTEHLLPSDAAVLTAYRDHFGIILDRVPAVRPA